MAYSTGPGRASLPLERPAPVVPFNVRRSRASVRQVVHLGLEFGGLLDQARRGIRIRDCLGEFEKRCCLTRQMMPADHFVVSGLQAPSPAPQTLHCSAEFVPARRYKVNI